MAVEDGKAVRKGRPGGMGDRVERLASRVGWRAWRGAGQVGWLAWSGGGPGKVAGLVV